MTLRSPPSWLLMIERSAQELTDAVDLELAALGVRVTQLQARERPPAVVLATSPDPNRRGVEVAWRVAVELAPLWAAGLFDDDHVALIVTIGNRVETSASHSTMKAVAAGASRGEWRDGIDVVLLGPDSAATE